jgi:glycosyltransferase involved in cell wall biosynthesis
MTVRVAMVTQYPAVPERPRGGVEAVSVTLATALAQHPDLDLHVVTLDPEAAAPGRSQQGRITVHRLPRRGRFTLTSALRSGRQDVGAALRELRPDVVHAHDTYGLMVRGVPYPRVFTVHGFIHADTLVSGGRLASLRARLWRRIETAGWADQPHIVSISPYVRERLGGIARGRIHDIENPIAGSFFSVERRETPGVVFSAALVEPRKNTLALVEAAARLQRAGVECQLRLAGRISDSAYGEAVTSRIRTLGLEQSVTLLGGLSAGAVADELARASVFALVSLEENAPLGVAEAMAVGVPVVTSDRCGMPYMVRHGETGFLVDPLDADDIARRLGTLLTGDALRKSMGIQASQEARHRFHPEAVAARTRALYEEIAAEGRR